MHTTLLGRTGASSRTPASGIGSPDRLNGANGWPSIGVTVKDAGSAPSSRGPSTTPNRTSPPSAEKRAIRTCGLPTRGEVLRLPGSECQTRVIKDSVTEVAELRVRLLGGLAVEGVPVLSLGSRKARAVLRRLAIAPDGWVSADALVDAAWPEGPPVRDADQLAVLISRLRGVLGADRLPRHPAGYSLRADWVDVLALREHIAAAEASLPHDPARALEHGRAAVALLAGPLLPEDDSEPVAEERAAVDVLASRARLLTAKAALETGAPWEALEVALRAREQDPYDEAALRLVLRALASTSRPAAAVSTYLEAARRLRD